MAALGEGSLAIDVPRLFQALVAPAIFVSGAGLLLLSLNARLMGMVSRLRQYLHEAHDASRRGRFAEAEAYASQIGSIQDRAELIRRAFLLTLLSLIGTIASCLLLGLGISFRSAAFGAAILFVVSILLLLCGSIYYVAEVRVSLTSVREEAADSRFMDLPYTDLDDKTTRQLAALCERLDDRNVFATSEKKK
jgi:hypothetical protein